MNRNYCLTGTKIVIRRLFKQDINDAVSCYEKYKTLYHNPVSSAFIENILLCGELWGAFTGDDIIGCCYYFPLNSCFYKNSPSRETLADFIPETEKYYYMGYVGIKEEKICRTEAECCNMPTEDGLYQAFLNIAQMQAFRKGFKYLVHCCPVKLGCPLETLFSCGCKLIKLRGLEKLVVHYVFAKPVYSEENIYETDTASATEKLPLADTKKVSALLENGYCGVDYSKDKDLLLMCRLITD